MTRRDGITTLLFVVEYMKGLRATRRHRAAALFVDERDCELEGR